MKRKISICTGLFQKRYGPIRALEIAKEVNADAVDFDLCGTYDRSRPDNLYSKGDEAVIEHFTEIKKYADSIGIEIAQTHGRIKGLSGDTKIDADRYADGRLDCIATRILGAKHCVMHTVSQHNLPNAAPEELRRMNFELFTTMIPYAKENGIKIATETFGNSGELPEFFSNIEEFIAGYEAVASVEDFRDYFCYCMDTGHTNMSTRHFGNPSVPDYTRRLGHAVEVLHINDNESYSDMHNTPLLLREPYARTGAIDWLDFMKALDDIGYEGYYNLELGWDNHFTNFAIEEAAYTVKVMKNLLRVHFDEPQEGFIDESLLTDIDIKRFNKF